MGGVKCRRGVSVLARKFVCPTHSEAKQTKTLRLGAEKGLLQGPARRQVAHALKSLELPKRFRQSIV